MIVPLNVSSGKRAVAVLTPNQVKLIEDKLNADYKIRTRYLLTTFMRLVEASYVDVHRETFREDHCAIFLPKNQEIGKERATIVNRTISLTPKGVSAVKDFFDKNVHIPRYQSMEPAIRLAAKEAGFDIRYITTKMYRKTYVSWLIHAFPERETSILHSAGHSLGVMRGHYLAKGFKKEDIKDIKDEVQGWDEA